MNKYNLEVGDKLGQNPITEITACGINFGEPSTISQFFNWSEANKRIEKSKDDPCASWYINKRERLEEIINYKLLRDLPSVPAGTISHPMEYAPLSKTHITFGEGDAYSYPLDGEDLKNREWFEPIYKPKVIVAYMLAKDLPGVKSGKIIPILSGNLLAFGSDDSYIRGWYEFDKSVLSNTEWFTPVYSPFPIL